MDNRRNPGESNGDARGARIVLAHEPPRRVGPLTIEPAMRRIGHADGREAIVEPRVMQVLVALLRAEGAILSREDLTRCCWDGRIVGEDAITRVISRLRRLEEGIGRGVLRVETVTKVGHRLVVEPTPDATRAAAPRGQARRLTPLRLAGAAVLVLALAAAASLLLRSQPSTASAPELSLAVLPFRDLSPEGDSAYYAEGVAEEIMALLSNQPDLRVAGRSSAAMLGSGAGFREARRRLGVSHLLEGSVRRDGDRVRINVRLLQTSDGMQVWSQAFERPLGDIFAVQDEIGATVAARLNGSLTASPGAGNRGSSTSSEVYDLYLAANSLAHRREYEPLMEAKRLLERAIAIDPDYAPAHARIAIYLYIINQLRPTGMYQDDETQRALAQRHIMRALALAPNLAEAHAAMGMLLQQRDPRQALEHNHRAIALDPNSFLAWNSSGNALNYLCRHADALTYYRRAAAIEPLLRVPYENMIQNLTALGRFDEAEAVRRVFAARSRESASGHDMHSRIALHRGDFSLATVQARAALAAEPDAYRFKWRLAIALHAIGDTAAAADMLPEADRATLGAYWTGNYPDAAAHARDAGMWNDEIRATAIARALQRTGQNSRLLRLFAYRYPTLGDFDRERACLLPYMAPPIIAALRAEGRHDLAESLLGLAERRARQAAAAGFWRPSLEVATAMLMTMRGDHEAALSSLERAAQIGWAGQHGEILDLADPVFDPIRRDPRFAAVERRIAAERERERRELASATARRPARRG